MQSEKVSVVIPTYNRAYCLPAAIGSLQAQTYPNWEALIIDDGSTDGTRDLVRSMSEADRRVKYHYQKNAGVSAARNTGIRLADGEWVGFLDSDDSWEPWKLSAQIACFKSLNNVGMVWTDMNGYDPEGNLVSVRHLRKMYGAYERVAHRRLFLGQRRLSEIAPELTAQNDSLADAIVHWGELYTAMMFGSLVHTSTVLIAHHRIRSVGFFDERYRTGEDYDFHLRTCLFGPVALLDVPSIRYRMAGGTDQLTAPKYRLEIALNGLRIREAAIARDRGRIELSDEELATIMARANSWVAEELFQQGNFAEARAYFRRSGLLEDPKLRSILKASLSHLPGTFASSMLSLIRRGKEKLKGRRE
jgi:glycosyltransferase involved in cell wall biosynthesis